MNYNIGQIIDDYTIIDLEKDANYSVNVIMKCNICGHIYKVRSSHIAEYKIKYPNAFMHSEKRCYSIQERYPIGTIYGDFSIIDYVKDKRKATNLVCKCNICANEIILSPSTLANVYSFNINHSITCNKIKYNGLAQLHPRLYNIWYSMTYRCTNQKCNYYDIYGGRGITTEYTKDLKGFPGFIQDMADSYYAHIQSLINAGFDESYAIKNTTIDRIDNNKGYYKDNIRWATARQQTQNRRCVIFL